MTEQNPVDPKDTDTDTKDAGRPLPADRKPEPTQQDRGQIGLAVMVVLAIIASIVMLVAGSTAALKIALLAALWAAVVGFFLVNRYRREAESSAEALALSEKLHQSELDRIAAEHAADRERSASAVRSDADLAADKDVLAEIKKELASIRSQLEDLSGREFTYEPAALRAEARRIMEVEARTYAADRALGAELSSPYDRYSAQSMPAEETPEVQFTQASSGAPSADAIAGRVGNQPQSATARQSNPLADLINERTAKAETAKAETKAKAEPESQKPKAKAPQPHKPESQPAPAAKNAEPKQQPQKKPQSPESTFNTGSFQAVRWDAGGNDEAKVAARRGHHAKPESSNETKREAKFAKQPAAQQSSYVGRRRKPEPEVQDNASHGRRRSDEHREGSVSVAELMAQMKKRNK